MAAKDILGRTGEDYAARHLADTGYRILERNWRCPEGELDIVAEHHGEVVFVEVKTRSGLGYGHPFEAITARKLARLRRLAAAWCRQERAEAHGVSVQRIRIDAIAVIAQPGREPELHHLERVF